MATLQDPAPLQSVPQPLKSYPLAGAAVSATAVPAAKSAPHVLESQSIPAGADVTFPLPWTITVRCRFAAGGGGGGGGVPSAKLAVTSRSASMVRSHPALPLQAPLHPEKEAPVSGKA